MDKLKEILFGFIVIAALGVIFVPMLFTDQKGSKEAVTSVPPKPVEYKLAQAQSKEHSLTELKETVHPEPVVVDQPIHDEPKAVTQAIVKHENMSATATPTPHPQQTLASAATKQEPVQELKHESKHEAKQEPVQEPVQEPIHELKHEAKHEPKHEPKHELKQEVPAVPAAKSVIPSAPQSTQIKEPPAIPETPTEPPKPKAKELIHPSHTEAPITKPLEKAPSEPKKSKPVKSGWVVQVGTFAVHDNAINLVKKLKRNGFPAYTKNLYRSGQNFTVVLVGPHSQQEAAMRTMDAIADQYGLRGEVIHFAPSKSNQEEDSQ